ncbi:hypothetical protein H6P81_005841 [Aristolochia fimbriata]|uniref:tRNA (guanine(46)-N(7))-methyltransferase n=1 Tax=Aristolochia fimbriata TaxID=158543 RepID=A0AAV7EZ59_ARIFI|nr:hypothetical protein H6P81_005841 [Aristolochia fimbriata]
MVIAGGRIRTDFLWACKPLCVPRSPSISAFKAFTNNVKVATRQACRSLNVTNFSSLRSTDLVELEYAQLGLKEKTFDMGHVRIRQHVNPLSSSFLSPAEVPNWLQVFKDPTLPLMVDIGCGSGRFLIWLAKQDPDLKNFLGLEIRQKLVKRSQFWVNELGLRNIHFLFANATVSFEQLVSSYPGPLILVSVLCPDPYFKKRHHKRRVLQKPLVESIVKNLTPKGQVFVQSDVHEVAVYIRKQFDALSEVQHVDAIDPSFKCDPQGWLVNNPLGIRTEREIHAEFEGAQILSKVPDPGRLGGWEGLEREQTTRREAWRGRMEEEARKTAVALLPGVISELLLVIILLLFPVPPNNGSTCVSNHLFSPSPPGTATRSKTALLLYLLTSSQLALCLSLRSHPLLGQPNNSSPSSSSSSSDAAAAAASTCSVSSRKRKRRLKSRSPPATSSIPIPSHLAVLPDPDSYPEVFNMTSPTFEWLSGLLDPLLDCRDPAGSHLNLSSHLRLAIGLFRLASGSSYDDISARFCVSLSTSKFCTKQLCRVLCTNFRFWLAFPSPYDILSVSSTFQTLGGGGLPNCCGILSCTHFQQRDEEESITAQIVVDASSKILSITAGHRGNKGDLEILKSSTFYREIVGGQLLNSPPVCLNGVAVPQYVMGDGAYPLLPWLMVPFVEPAPLSAEEDFNAVHQSLCRPALRTIASLRKWGILSQPIDEETNLAVACIGACAILHNMLLTREDYSALSDGSEDYSGFDHSSRECGASSSLEGSVERSALDTRNALAASVKGHCSRSDYN